MLDQETASLDEVAAALGRSAGWLRRNWLKLSIEQNFPRKIAAGPVWPRRAVESWLRSGGNALPQAANQNGVADFVADAAEALKARFGAQT